MSKVRQRPNAGKANANANAKGAPAAAVEQSCPVETKHFRIHNFVDGPLDLTTLGPLFQLVEDRIGNEFAALFAVRASRNAAHHDVDYALLQMPSRLPCGSLQKFIIEQQHLADLAADMGLANEE